MGNKALASRLVAGALTIGTLAAVADSASAFTTYEASTAYKDQYGGHGDGHAFWFPGMAGGKKFVFEGDSGIFEYDDLAHTASLTGTIVSTKDANKKWDVDLSFGLSSYSTPKKELKLEAYSNNGGPVDTSTWKYFDLLDSTITGLGEFTGLNVELSQRPVSGPYAFQLGDGANGKNVDYGFSGWYGWEITGEEEVVEAYAAKYGERKLSGKGDINIDLEKTPEPGTLGALGIGVLGLAGLAKRKRDDETDRSA